MTLLNERLIINKLGPFDVRPFQVAGQCIEISANLNCRNFARVPDPFPTRSKILVPRDFCVRLVLSKVNAGLGPRVDCLLDQSEQVTALLM